MEVNPAATRLHPVNDAMAALVRAFDWSRTPLGTMDRWPDELRVAVDICLNSRFPMFVWWGPELINIYNDGYVSMLGDRHPAALGRPAAETWADIWSVVGPQADAVIQRGESTWNERVKLVTERKGYPEETYFTWSYSPIRDKSGRIAGLFCAVSEETERVRAEEERDRLATQRQLALDAAEMGWWHYDPATKVSRFDRRYGEIIGVAGDHLPSEELIKRIHPDDRPGVSAKMEAALNPRDPRPYWVEYRVVHDDGSQRWVEAHGTAHFDGDGAGRRATSFVGTAADVTERKHAEEQPRRILESITDAFFALDADWRFTYLNPQAQRVLGRTPDELIGQVIWDAYPDLKGGEFEQAYRRAGTDGTASSVTSFFAPHDRWYEVHAYPAAGGGISVYFRDVTDRRHGEERLRRSHDTFHDLIQNNPFGVYVVDADFRLRQVSLGAQKVFEHVPRPLLGRDFGEVLRSIWAEPFASDAIARFRHTLESGEPFAATRTIERREDIGDVEAYDWRIERISMPDGRFGVVCYFYDLSERQRWEAMLSDARRRLDSALIAGEVGTFEWDVVKDRLWGDRNFARIFGIERDADGAASLAEYLAAIHPEDRGAVAERVRQAVEMGRDYEAEYRISTSEPPRWVIARGRVERDGTGGALRFPGVVLDVTEQKRAEAALRESEERLRAIFDQSESGIAQVDLTGRFILVNERYTQIVGRGLAELLTLRMQDITHPDDLPHNVALFQNAVADGRPFTIQKRYVRPDGSEVWVSNSVSVLRDARGVVSGVVAACVDITEQRRAEAALLESEARFRQLADAMPQMVWVARPDGHHEYFNSRWYEYTGVPEGSTDGEGWSGMFHADDQDRAWAAWRQSLATGEPYEIEYRLRHRSGEYRWTLGRALPIRNDRGEIERWFGTCTDIDAIKRLQSEREHLLDSERSARAQAERASRMKDEFLATLSHELRTPLNAILGWSQILASGAQDEADLAEGLRTIERNARAQTQIIEDLLDMSRIISGKVRLDVQRVDLGELVRLAVETAKPSAEARSIRLHAVLDPHAGPISGDPNRLQQVLWNLLSNALKFTPKGGRVQVLLERVNSHVEVTVTDTGEGISPEFLPHVFDRFQQADATTTRRHGGLGLGLSIVKQLVELHGGTVRAESLGHGHGATFTVALPLIAIHSEPESAGDRRHPRSSSSSTPALLSDSRMHLAGVKVLVVDDELDARALVQRLLEDCQAQVITAGSAAEAVERMRMERPHVLVSDVGMPSEDGYSLIKQVRGLEPEAGGRVPAIALTAYARAEDRVRAITAGFDMHLAKPIEPGELIAMVASLAGRSR